MAASRRVSPAAARPPGSSAPRARGRRRRPSLWRRLLLALPRPAPTLYIDPAAALQDEVHELRLAVAALRAEVTRLHARLPGAPVAEPEPVVDLRGPAAVTLVLPLARAAALAGVPADGVVTLDISADTAATEIVLTPAVFPAASRTAAPAAAMAEAPAAAMAEAPAAAMAEAMAEEMAGAPGEAPAGAVAAHESVAPRVSMLPEAPLLDPRLARVAEALDDLLGDEAAAPASSSPSPSHGDHAIVAVREAG